jgi:hypothetical protein
MRQHGNRGQSLSGRPPVCRLRQKNKKCDGESRLAFSKGGESCSRSDHHLHRRIAPIARPRRALGNYIHHNRSRAGENIVRRRRLGSLHRRVGQRRERHAPIVNRCRVKRLLLCRQIAAEFAKLHRHRRQGQHADRIAAGLLRGKPSRQQLRQVALGGELPMAGQFRERRY